MCSYWLRTWRPRMYTPFAYAFAYVIKQTPYAFVAKIILCMYLLYDGGVILTMACVRTRYWIPRLRWLVKKVRKRCYGCKRLTATAYSTPSPGKLPTTRTQGKNAFQVIGVDFAGPLKYQAEKKREGKAYILLYACSLTRGIMIDLLPNMTTDEFLLSLKRFTA